MKRVGIITYQAFPRGEGGGTRYAATLARWASTAGYAVTLIARSPDASEHCSRVDNIDIVELGGFRIRSLPSARFIDRDFFFAKAIRRYLSREGPEFDLLHTIIPDTFRAIPRNLRSRTIVSVIEDFWTPKIFWASRFLNRFQQAQAVLATREAGLVTLPSQTAFDFFREHLRADPHRLRLIYDFVDESIFPTEGSTVLSETPRLFVPQRAVAQKKVDTAIRAFLELRQGWPRLRLAIAGGGPLVPRLKKLSKRLGCADGIEWLGVVPFLQMQEQYRSSDVVIITSASEGAQPSPTAAEAMACGRPVIMTDVCDTDRVFQDCVPQYQPGDVQGLVRCTEKILGDYQASLKQAAIARERILRRFSLHEFLGRVDDAYRLLAS